MNPLARLCCALALVLLYISIGVPSVTRSSTGAARRPQQHEDARPARAASSASLSAQSAEVTSIRKIDLAANDLVFDPNTQTIYASVPSRAGARGNSITAINPSAGEVGASVLVGSEPGRMARSDDGQFIYVSLDGAAAVRRFDVNTQTAALQFPLGNIGFEGPVFVRDLAVMPGSPHALAVARRKSPGFSPDTWSAAIYDDGVPRPAAEPSSQGSSFIEFSNSPSLLYGTASDGLHRMTVGASGITQNSRLAVFVSGDFKVENGLLYSAVGQVVDPSNGAVVGTYPNVTPGPFGGLFNRVIIEPGVSRTYFLTGGGTFDDSVNGTATIRVFDQHTFQPTGSINVTGVNGHVAGFVRWGANGLAFGTTGGQVFLVQTTLVPSTEPVPAPTPTLPPTPTPTPVPTPAPGELRQLPLPARDLVFDPNAQTIYASSGSGAGAFSDSVTPFDPATGALGTPVAVGAGANKMAISDDGQSVYVGLDTASAVRRFDVATLTAGIQFALKQDSAEGFLRAEDLSVMPGNPGAVAVARSSLGSGDIRAAGVALYDDGVQRSAVAPGGSAVKFSSSPSVLYGYNNFGSDRGFRKMVAGPCGVAEASVTFRVVGGDLKYDNGLVYDSTGRALDPESGILLGTFVTAGVTFFNSALATDSKAGRVYFVLGDRLRVFDMKTFLPLGELRLPGVTGAAVRLVRWGAHGLAFNTRDTSTSPNDTFRTYVLEHALVAGPSGTFTPAPPPPTPTLTIKGQVTFFDGVSGVQLNVSGGFTTTAVTDAGGNYSIGNIPHCADITITPTKENYTFTPPSVRLTNPGGTPRLNFNALPKRVFVSSSIQHVPESRNVVQVFVRRDGDLSQPLTVDYETEDGTASGRSDYTAAFGTLRFAPNESTKSLSILVADDNLVEGPETLTVRLKNPSGAMFLPQFDAQAITINDNDTSQPATNPLDDSTFFVRQHYADFFGRAPDAGGLAFWTGGIDSCGADAGCIFNKRVDTSAAFFLSIEFQETGFLVHRVYKAAFGDATGSAVINNVPTTIKVPVVRLNEFLPDTQRLGRDVIVGTPGWPERLEANKAAFAREFVARVRFTTAFPAGMTPEQFVDRLDANAGGVLSAEERAALVAELGADNTAAGRASVLRKVAEDAELVSAETNKAFVLMQYFGYLRRNPNDPPDTDHSGYHFWLTKLDQFGGDWRAAQMVFAFIDSFEYRRRFAP